MTAARTPRPARDLGGAIAALARVHGAPEGPPTKDPFELVLFENVAYLAPPEKRREAFEELRRAVGTRPERLLAARPGELERITACGILKGTSAEKLRESARIAAEEAGGDLAAALDANPAGAKKILRKFPGIGEPGADKVLLFSGRAATLAPESNGLRVLQRLGLVAEEASYARAYAAAQSAGAALPARGEVLRRAHLLLQQHGRTICRRSDPLCDACPLAKGCAYAMRSRSRRAARGPAPGKA